MTIASAQKQLQLAQLCESYIQTADCDLIRGLRKTMKDLIPIEMKFQNLAPPSIARGYRSFLRAYHSPAGVVRQQKSGGRI